MRRAALIGSFLFAACGRPSLTIGAISPDLQPVIDGLRANLQGELGYDALSGQGGLPWHVYSNTGEVQRASDFDGVPAIAMTLRFSRQLVVTEMDTCVYIEDKIHTGYLKDDRKMCMTEKIRLIVLAHELGHALGLEHTTSKVGLMAPVADYDCIGREAACLAEALREQGLVD